MAEKRADSERRVRMRMRRGAERGRMFQTRSHSWAEAGLARQLSRAAVKRARIETLLLIPLAVAVLLLYSHRRALFPGWGLQIRIVTVVVLLAIGWALARAAGRALAPHLMRRVDPGTAGTVGFIIRLITMVVALVVALRIAGVRPRDLAVGGAFTAVVVGLAAQQTLGNLFAGTVLLSARPFRVGERIRLQGGGLAGTIEGVVSSLGLLYTVLSDGEDEIMVPNNVVLSVAVIPLREPDAIDLRARLRPGVTPADIQHLLDETIETPLIEPPRILLQEVDGDEVVVRVQATPVQAIDGPRLATEVLEAIGRETRKVTDASADGDGDGRDGRDGRVAVGAGAPADR
jgi:small conductance mechanosensitive channel